MKGGQPIGPEAPAQVQPFFGIEPKDLNDASQCLSGGLVAVFGTTTALEAINVGDLGRHDAGLIEHHAAGKEAEQYGLDEQTKDAQHLGGFVQTREMVCPDVSVPAQAVEKAK